MNINPHDDEDYLKWRLKRKKRNRKGQTFVEVQQEFKEAWDDLMQAIKQVFFNLLKTLKVIK